MFGWKALPGGGVASNVSRNASDKPAFHNMRR